MSTKLQTISPAETETGLDDTMRDAEEIHSDYSQQKETIQPKPPVIIKKRISKVYEFHGVFPSLEAAQNELEITT